jgi:hypothetical protein
MWFGLMNPLSFSTSAEEAIEHGELQMKISLLLLLENYRRDTHNLRSGVGLLMIGRVLVIAGF